MAPLCYRRYRFPPQIIQHAIWLYLRFTLSYRDVEELLAQRALDISYESVRSWVLKFGLGCVPCEQGQNYRSTWELYASSPGDCPLKWRNPGFNVPARRFLDRSHRRSRCLLVRK